MVLRTAAIIAAILACQVLPQPLAAQRFDVQRLTARDIPSRLGIVGTVEAARRWTDRNGQNLLILARTAEYRSTDSYGTPFRNREIHGYHFIAQGAGYRLLWQTVDFVKECQEDIALEYAPGSLQVTDVDEDGVAETTYVYELGCMGGLDPASLKLIMHEGATKYAIRGFQDLREMGHDYPAPEMHVESALASQPWLRDYAVAHYRRFLPFSAWREEGAP